jgi:peptidoglycan/xylan/chitin deacetylase (PgdA/CDA1 family)
VEQAIVNIIGKAPTYIRPPYLETGGSVMSVTSQLGYRVVTDDIDTGDWNNQSPQSSEQKFQQAGAGGNGHIPLMHEVYQGTVNTLTPWLINWAKQNNLKLVTVGTYCFYACLAHSRMLIGYS